MNKHTIAILFLFLTFIISAGPANAQSRYLQDEQNGAAIIGSLSSGENYTNLGAAFSYSFGAKFDVGLGVSRSNFDDEVIGNDGSATEITPFALFSVVRPTDLSNVGVELGASYGFANFSSDGLDFLNWDMTAKALVAGVNLYLRLESSPTLTVYPVASIDYVSATAKIEDSTGDSIEEDTSDVAFGLAANLVFNGKVVVTPAFRSLDGNSSWGLSIGLVIPGT